MGGTLEFLMFRFFQSAVENARKVRVALMNVGNSTRAVKVERKRIRPSTTPTKHLFSVCFYIRLVKLSSHVCYVIS